MSVCMDVSCVPTESFPVPLLVVGASAKDALSVVWIGHSLCGHLSIGAVLETTFPVHPFRYVRPIRKCDDLIRTDEYDINSLLSNNHLAAPTCAVVSSELDNGFWCHYCTCLFTSFLVSLS